MNNGSFDRFAAGPPALFKLAAFLVCVFCATRSCEAIITGGAGNKPIHDPGWPTGAAKVFNWPTRIAWWEGPPFGGGQWHAESKGDAKVINQVLQAFAQIDTPGKRVIVKEGVGTSFWLDPNKIKQGKDDIRINWSFTIWERKKWDFQKTLPADMSAVHRSKDKAPVPELLIYTGAVKWADIQVPDGIEVVDNRMEAHGFTASDGRVIEGRVTDTLTGKPLQAKISVERVIPQKTGGYNYTPAESSVTDKDGKWQLTNMSREWSRLVISADGYAPRVVRYVRYDDQPGWEQANTTLAKTGDIEGKVQTPDGKPLAGVDIHITGITVTGESSAYELRNESSSTKTDELGNFKLSGLPQGKGRVIAFHAGHVGAGRRPPIAIPSGDTVIELKQAGTLKVQVKFKRPRGDAGYIVEVVPKGGEKVGSWGGSSKLSKDDSVLFKNIPPGEYVVFGRPNPGRSSQKTDAQIVSITGGTDSSVEIEAK